MSTYINPVEAKFPNHGMNALNYYFRTGKFPLDSTTVWNTLEDFEAYLEEQGSYAYPGQIVSVMNGDAYDTDNTSGVSIYVVRADGGYQPITSGLKFDDYDTAAAYVLANKSVATPGTTCTILNDEGDQYDLYTITPEYGLARVSFDSENGVVDAANVVSVNGSQLDISVIPAAALNKLLIVDDMEAMLELTIEDVQNWDTVQLADTLEMYRVIDDENLDQIESYVLYTAGTASSVEWQNVQNVPEELLNIEETIQNMIDDNFTKVGGVENAGKAIVINDEGELTVDIRWKQIIDIPSAVNELDDFLNSDGVLRLTYNGKEVASMDDVKEAYEVNCIPLVGPDELPEEAIVGQVFFEAFVSGETVSTPTITTDAENLVYTGSEITPEWDIDSLGDESEGDGEVSAEPADGET